MGLDKARVPRPAEHAVATLVPAAVERATHTGSNVVTIVFRARRDPMTPIFV